LKKQSRTSSLTEAVETIVKQQQCVYILADTVVQELTRYIVLGITKTCTYVDTYQQMELAYILMINSAVCNIFMKCIYS
jgi:hypothetical protein